VREALAALTLIPRNTPADFYMIDMSFCRDVRITRSAAGKANWELGSRLNVNDRLNLAPYLSSPRVHGLYTCGPGQARYQLLSIVKSLGIALAGNSHKGRRNLSASESLTAKLSK
jgi:hypothetical protein